MCVFMVIIEEGFAANEHALRVLIAEEERCRLRNEVIRDGEIRRRGEILSRGKVTEAAVGLGVFKREVFLKDASRPKIDSRTWRPVSDRIQRVTRSSPSGVISRVMVDMRDDPL
jgi:hypothetical protein